MTVLLHLKNQKKVTRLDAINDGQSALGRHETSTPTVANTTINKVEVKTDPTKVSGSRDVKVTHANDAELNKTYVMLIKFSMIKGAGEGRNH